MCNLRGLEIWVRSTFSTHRLTSNSTSTPMRLRMTSKRSLPRWSVGDDKAKRAAKHAEKVDRKSKHIAGIKAKFQNHNIIQRKKNDLRHEHLDFLRNQAVAKKQRHQREATLNDLTILRTSVEGLEPEDADVVWAMKEKIRERLMGKV